MLTSRVQAGLRGGLSGFISGAASVFWGLKRMLGDPEMRKLAMLPLLITGVAYLGLFAGVVFFAGDVLERFWPQPSECVWAWDPDGVWAGVKIIASFVWCEFFHLLWYLALLGFLLAFTVILALLFATIAEAVGGPFYDKMAIKQLTEHHIAYKEPGLIEGTVPDLFRSFLFLIPAAIFGVIGIFFPPMSILGGIVAWLGFASSAINPALLLTGKGLAARLNYVFRYFLAMLGIGGVVGLSMLIPFLGLFMIPASIVGATELYARSPDRS